MFSLKNKTAIITGAGSGIGRAIALLFAEQGAVIHILDLDSEAAEQVAGEIKKDNGKAKAHKVNVTDQQQLKQVLQNIGEVHVLVNNAGIAHIGKAETTEEADFDRVINVNVKGVYNCIHSVIPKMRAAGGGVILNLGSIAGLLGLPDRFAYSTAKGAVMAMTLSVARDYLRENIRCNSISPARVHTPFVDGFIQKNYPGKESEMFDKLSKSQPIGRMAKPEEVAYLALYLCSDEAAFITGADYPIDGGFINLNT
jgi:2-keto-3-deoxy-L-fuconate dehydrogenase